MENIVLISSTGGHWSQLIEIYQKCKKKDNIYLITEKNATNDNIKGILFLTQQDRKSNWFIFVFLYNVIKSLYFVLKIKPIEVISTGAGMAVPFLMFSKIVGSKIIFIESFAKVTSPTLTGRIVYKFADEFFVQWPEMLKIYPKAKYRGSLY
ncbi:MAG: PssD/Cps14F family polysaccharide biosynthesis glycosyltransferase [Sporolactobacillus sp.]